MSVENRNNNGVTLVPFMLMLMLAAIVGTIFGDMTATKDHNRQAVLRGYAHYVVDSYGKSTFVWNEPDKKP